MKALRRSRGWTQEHLADISGLHIRTVQRVERGHAPSLETLAALAAAFDVDVDTLKQNLVPEDEMFEGANPVLPVRNVRDTVTFFVEKLGFDVEVLWDDPPYAAVARGNAVIEFGEGRADVAGTGVCLLFVRDVDAVYRHCLETGVELVGNLADRDYGSRDFRARDNNGNLLIFSGPLATQVTLLKARGARPG